MKRIDILIVAALAAAAIASAVGVLTWEEQGDQAYSATWSTETTRMDFPGRTHTGAGAAETTLEVTQANLTRGEVLVRVTSNANARLQPVAFTVQLEVPGQEPVQAQGEFPAGASTAATTREVRLTVDLAALPEARDVRAGSLDEARQSTLTA
ncbi:MAG TPA: hypothetical protein VFH47_00030, partial [Candidatus Thermoplasmatota archaeon]|nr:hypothetical protein [Candidatus Thermoplasmatota archaeon]